MPHALEIEKVDAGVILWRCYDPAIKTDLFSTGLQIEQRIFLVDPIALAPDAMADLKGVAGVVVTNENHLRAATQFADWFHVPIYAEGTVAAACPGAIPTGGGGPFAPRLTAVSIEGAAIGEIAVHCDRAMGTIVVGDALINFEPYGFTFLPAKYCSNFKLMRTSLLRLLDYSFDRMLFAHGMPILSGAREHLETLLKARH